MATQTPTRASVEHSCKSDENLASSRSVPRAKAPHYDRSAFAQAPLRVDTPSVRTILRLHRDFRVINSEQIARLVPLSPDHLSHLLKTMWRNGLIDRPECQKDSHQHGGDSKPKVTALSDHGARLLMELDGYEQAPRVNWSRKNRAIKRLFLAHHLLTAEFATRTIASVDAGTELAIDHGYGQRQQLPNTGRRLDKPFKLPTTFFHDGRRHITTLEPDWPFTLTTREPRRAHYLTEIDTGQMPVVRANLHQSSILKKLLGYDAIVKMKQHTKQLGWPTFRVPILTNS